MAEDTIPSILPASMAETATQAAMLMYSAIPLSAHMLIPAAQNTDMAAMAKTDLSSFFSSVLMVSRKLFSSRLRAPPVS